MNISFILLSYNQENYIREALEAVLHQNCQPLEIIVSDDCSTDNTCEITKEVLNHYIGKHYVVFNKNENNLGIAKHFNKVVSEFCHGDIIITADGDDISFPERTQRTIDLFAENPGIMGLSFEKVLIDNNGRIINDFRNSPLEILKISFEDYINSGIITFCGSSRAFRREVMDYFGPLEYSDGNDIYVFNRCLMMGGYLYSNEKMIYYRIHDNNTDQAKCYTKEFVNHAELQLKSDLKFAVDRGLVSKESASKATRKRINLIIRKFKITYYSYYHPSFYSLIIWRRRIKKLIKISFPN